ncbi:MAG TPA: hypothetical protein DCY40_08765, partial [Actinobacteria bacterium]|nr:hypothetical protein [Actinomycetota bacterium]
MSIERLPVKLQAVGDVDKKDGGWVYSALAQFYELVNDRLMFFVYGSGLKTIAERVPTGRVKIHSGHPYDPNAATILGKVIEARETRGDGGVWYRGYLSGSEEKVATKLLEGVIDENSLELFVLREADREVEIADVPEHVRRWIRVEPNGKTLVREIREWRWDAIGLVSSSSQGRRALLDPPTMIPFDDLPLASATTAWDPKAAAARVA